MYPLQSQIPSQNGTNVFNSQIDNTEFSLGGKLENYITYITTL